MKAPALNKIYLPATGSTIKVPEHSNFINELTLLKLDNNFNFKEKANLIRKIKDNIYQLKQGKLVSYNL